jgi:tetratricopeptide (TPR) repeat protein
MGALRLALGGVSRPALVAALALAAAAALLGACGGGVEGERQQGFALYEAGDFANAIPLLQKVTEKRPDDVEARTQLAMALTKSGEGNAAIDQWLRLLKLRANWPEGHYWLGIAYISAGKQDEAVKQWVRTVELDSTHVAAHYNLGFAYVRMGLLPVAVEEWSNVLMLDPTHLEARANRARILVAQGDLRGGLADFLVALAIKPEDPINWLSLGETHFLLNDSAAAVAAIDSFFAKQKGMDEVAAKAQDLRDRIVAGEKPPEIEYSPFAFWPASNTP